MYVIVCATHKDRQSERYIGAGQLNCGGFLLTHFPWGGDFCFSFAAACELSLALARSLFSAAPLALKMGQAASAAGRSADEQKQLGALPMPCIGEREDIEGVKGVGA